jgi:hypothetical protein
MKPWEIIWKMAPCTPELGHGEQAHGHKPMWATDE